MTLVIGTDEAGYGPNLGPLVVAASAWQVAGAPGRADGVLAAAGAAAADVWGDSKRFFHAGSGLGPLERGALAAVIAATGNLPADARALGDALAASGIVAPADHAAPLALPRACTPNECTSLAAALAVRLAASGVRLVAVRCRVIHPREFNRLLDMGLNKSDILSQATLDLAASLANEAPPPVLVWCDRHGGRKRYAAALAHAFAAPLVEVLDETPARSAYRLGAGGPEVEFQVGGEARMPVAVASMTAKYVRELSMAAFNAHWSARVPGLRATAGYPVDARRWRREATGAVEAAGLAWDDLWRRA
jgi:ribonuclease HII